MKIFSLTLTALLFTLSSYSQEYKYPEAEYDYDQGNFIDAIARYKQHLKHAENKIEKSVVWYRLGECYRDLQQFSNSYHAFKKSYQKDKSDYWVLLDLAKTARNKGDYSKSSKYLMRYLKNEPTDSAYAYSLIYSNRFAQAHDEENTSVEITPAHDLNSPEMDFSPAFLGSGNTICFTSTRQNTFKKNQNGANSTIYVSRKTANGFSTPTPLVDAQENINIGAPSIDYKRNIIYFTRCSNQTSGKKCQLYFAFLQGDLIGEAFPLNLFPNNEFISVVGHPAYANNLNMLFFVTDAPSGEGKRDIWKVEYFPEKNSWGTPEPLGAAINTPEDEYFPYLAQDNTLYFSSNGHNGFGGLDIYQSTFQADSTWGKPVNMLKPFNSSGDDFGLTFYPGRNGGLFTSNRNDGKNMDDIYSFSFEQEIDEQQPDSVRYFESAIQELISNETCAKLAPAISFEVIRLFPNPAHESFKIEIRSTENEKPVQLRIFTLNGKIVHEETLNLALGVNSFEINASALPPGMYNVSLSIGCKNLQTIPLIKQ